MKYRKFGKTGFEVSALGFGCMRLPTVEGGGIDEPLAVEMIRRGIDAGVNYLDTAYVYHGGDSERVIAKALRDGYREKVWVADKMPIWNVKEHADLDRLFAEQLDRLEMKKIDVFLLHNIQAPSWVRMRDLGSVEWLEKQRADGKVGRIGFSYHDDFDTLAEILDHHAGWDMCQIQYNYVNEEVQSGTKGLEYAASKGVAVVIMEPLLGGCLANAPEAVREVFDSAGSKRTPVDWALRWLWNKPEVATVLSGMSAMAHVEENLASAEASGVGTLSREELDTVARARAAYEGLKPIGCTGCAYCMPCPSDVYIPRMLKLYNGVLVHGGNQLGLNRNLYSDTPEAHRASACTECGECEAKCPQGIKISEWMPKVHEKLGPK